MTGVLKRVLILCHALHPVWPFLRSGPASPGPGAVDVVVLVPLQGPELFEVDLSNGPVHEGHVNGLAMSIDTDTSHFVRTGHTAGIAIRLRGLIDRVGPDVIPVAVHKRGDFILLFDPGDVLVII